jgi:hypothetical protein
MIIIIIRNGAKTISPQTSLGDLIIRNGANTICIQFRMISYSESFKIKWNYENWSWEK